MALLAMMHQRPCQSASAPFWVCCLFLGADSWYRRLLGWALRSDSDSCRRVNSVSNWRYLFDLELFGFHRWLGCRDCHPQPATQSKPSNGQQRAYCCSCQLLSWQCLKKPLLPTPRRTSALDALVYDSTFIQYEIIMLITWWKSKLI